MFIVSITYKVPLSDVEPHMPGHMAFLNEQYEAGCFIASGRKIPRTGGVILARADSREALDDILQQDPFYKHELAEFEITEFVVSKTSDALSALLD